MRDAPNRIILTIILSMVCVRGGWSRDYGLFEHDIDFTGTASGGVLTFVELYGVNPREISISTQPGESAASVAARLAAAINDKNPFGWYARKQKRQDPNPLKTEGGTIFRLSGSPLGHALAGTETGVGIPPTPKSVTATYDPDAKRYTLRWINPLGGYDRIGVSMSYREGAKPATRCSMMLPVDTTRHVFGLQNLGEVDVRVIGFRGTVPSNAAHVTITADGQEELMSMPFTGGVARNWTAWSVGVGGNGVACSQALKWPADERGRAYNKRVSKPDRKNIYQVVTISSDGAVGGVRREFIGLTGGHTYRISARLNTLDTGPELAGWALTLHAAHNGAGGKALTEAQLGGAAPLPDGSAGPTAGQIAAFAPGAATDGKWALRSTGRPALGSHVGDITLPDEAETITVWIKLTGPKGTTAGFDWIKLQDISLPAPE